MFDDPGKKLRQLEDELWSVEPQEEQVPETEDALYDYEEEEFDESCAVLVPEPKKNRAGATLMLLLVIIIGCLAAARWCFGWI